MALSVDVSLSVFRMPCFCGEAKVSFYIHGRRGVKFSSLYLQGSSVYTVQLQGTRRCGRLLIGLGELGESYQELRRALA